MATWLADRACATVESLLRQRGTVLAAALVAGSSGCAAFHPIAGVPVRYLPEELRTSEEVTRRTINPALLSQRPPSRHLVDSGDVLAVYVENVIGRRSDATPFVQQLPGQESLPALGYQIPVREDGTISLPLVGSIRVRGLTVAAVEDEVRRAYTESKQFLNPNGARVMVTLQKPRTYRVLVIRQEAGGGDQAISGGAGTFNLGFSKRGTGRVVTLPVYKNDVLNALAETGGLPGLDAENAIYIVRARGRNSGAGATGLPFENACPPSSNRSDAWETPPIVAPTVSRKTKPSVVIRGQSPDAGLSSWERERLPVRPREMSDPYAQSQGRTLPRVQPISADTDLDALAMQQMRSEIRPARGDANDGFEPVPPRRSSQPGPSNMAPQRPSHPHNEPSRDAIPPANGAWRQEPAPSNRPVPNTREPENHWLREMDRRVQEPAAGRNSAGNPWTQSFDAIQREPGQRIVEPGGPAQPPRAPQARPGSPMPAYGPAGAPPSLEYQRSQPPVEAQWADPHSVGPMNRSPFDGQNGSSMPPGFDPSQCGAGMGEMPPGFGLPPAYRRSARGSETGGPRDAAPSIGAFSAPPMDGAPFGPNGSSFGPPTGGSPAFSQPTIDPNSPWMAPGASGMNAPHGFSAPPGMGWNGSPPNNGMPYETSTHERSPHERPPFDGSRPDAGALPQFGQPAPSYAPPSYSPSSPSLHEESQLAAPAFAEDHIMPSFDHFDALDDLTIDNDRVTRIPVRLAPGERIELNPADVVLYDGDILFIEHRDSEVFYTGGLLGGGQYTLPRDYDLDILEAISIAQGGRGGGGSRATQSSGGVSALNADVSVSGSDIVILRKLPDGRQIPIKLNLYHVLRDPSQRIIVQPGDFIMLQYRPAEAALAFIERHLLEGAIFTVASSRLNSGGGGN